MNRDDILKIKASWSKLESSSGHFAEQFYARLFEFDPWLEKLFGADWRTGGKGMLGVIKILVDGLDDPAGSRQLMHKQVVAASAWGLREDDVYLICPALFAALEGELGSAFTSSARHAWGTACGELAQELLLTIQEAA
ncbi:hypothetical protein ACFL0R_01735 [Pseudomonadota bacterium]